MGATAEMAHGDRVVGRFLLLVSFVYLGIPNLLFALGWLKAPYALIYTGACLAGLAFLAKRLRGDVFSKDAESKRPKWSTGLFIVVCLFLVAWAGFSGIGGFGYQNSDWLAHNSLLMHLIEENWPLVLHSTNHNGAYYYVYYVGYYLPAALVGKLLGWTAANIFLFLWSVTGLIVAVSWFLTLLNLQARPRIVLLAAFIFALFGGLDYVGHYLQRSELPALDQHIEWWAMYFQYSATTTLLFWVPQHAIAAWILTGLLMSHSIFRLPPHSLGLCVAFGLLWTPFSIVGILPFVVLALIQWAKTNGIAEIFSLSNLVFAPVVGLTSALYLASNTFSFPITWGWVREQFVLHYLTFMTLEVVVFVAPLFWLARDRMRASAYAPWLWISVGILASLPFVRMGFNNDIVMRASIPALFVLILFVAYGILRQRLKARPVAKTALIAVFCAGALTGGSELVRSIKNYQLPPPNEQSVRDHLGLARSIVSQRRGDPESFFFRYLAKE